MSLGISLDGVSISSTYPSQSVGPFVGFIYTLCWCLWTVTKRPQITGRNIYRTTMVGTLDVFNLEASSFAFEHNCSLPLSQRVDLTARGGWDLVHWVVVIEDNEVLLKHGYGLHGKSIFN